MGDGTGCEQGLPHKFPCRTVRDSFVSGWDGLTSDSGRAAAACTCVRRLWGREVYWMMLCGWDRSVLGPTWE